MAEPAAAEFAFSSREFLRMIEGYGLTGSWGWDFAAGETTWSPGFHRLLGYEVGAVAPSYELFLSRVHPDDRPEMETVAQVVQDGLLRDHTCRVVRPDGQVCILSSRAEIYFTEEGRPRGAAGIAIDVTDRERLARSLRDDKRRRRALFEEAGVVTSWVPRPLAPDGADEALRVPGTVDELLDDPFRFIAPDERAGWARFLAQNAESDQALTLNSTLMLADGKRGQFTLTTVPVRGEGGALDGFVGFAAPSHAELLRSGQDFQSVPESDVQGHHLRASRALLDWSMHDFAEASGLSFSTIRRLEENADASGPRSRRAALAALTAAGIRFTRLDGAVAVMRL